MLFSIETLLAWLVRDSVAHAVVPDKQVTPYFRKLAKKQYEK